MLEHLHLAIATRRALCVSSQERLLFLSFKEILCMEFSWAWESFCFILGFPSDIEITSSVSTDSRRIGRTGTSEVPKDKGIFILRLEPEVFWLLLTPI